MATKRQVIELHRKHPDWTDRQIAEAIPGECSAAYVRATARRNGLTLGRALPPPAKRLRAKAADLLKRADELEKR